MRKENTETIGERRRSRAVSLYREGGDSPRVMTISWFGT